MNFPIEPSADLREVASAYRQMYVAFINQGFSEDQAYGLTKAVIAAASTSTGGSS